MTRKTRDHWIGRRELRLGAHLNAGTRHVIGSAAQLSRIVRYRDGWPRCAARSQGHPAAVHQHPTAARQREWRNHEIAGALGIDHVVDQDLPGLIVVSAGLDVLIALQAKCSEIDRARGIRTRRERIEQRPLLVGAAQLPSAERYQHHDQDNGEQRREGPGREDAGTDFD
jgi:hypothetical protein